MTNSKVLALKYRPKNFDELIGQESVSKTLKFSLQNDRLANAYLFSGLRGSGKTSSARIFSKTILCEKAPTSTPCEECESCKMANSGSHIDIIEMDAASNRGINDIREVIDQTQYQPSVGRFKIFIIDEVHMLTKEAFNALLKTLEEPPSHIKFILATTDPLKLPPTILSRTQHFNFKRIDQILVIEHLKKICQIEGVEFDELSLETITRSGDGSLRDTLTILQQAIVYCGDTLNITSVTEMLGLVDPKILDEVIDLVISKDRERIIKMVIQLQSYEVETVIDEMVALLKRSLFEKDKRLTLSIIEKMFISLNEAKSLLFTGADGGFVLLMTFLKMLEEERAKEIVYVQSETQKISKVENHEINIQSKSQEIVENRTNSYHEFFQIEIVQSILNANPKGKITDEILKNCIDNHVHFLSFDGENIDIKYCFENDKNDICKKVLRARYATIRTEVVRLFNLKSGNKTFFKYSECEIENAENFEETQNRNTQIEKEFENSEKKEKRQITLDLIKSDIMEILEIDEESFKND
jgi:DNA polymerase-3 subunit gamma/tau